MSKLQRHKHVQLN